MRERRKRKRRAAGVEEEQEGSCERRRGNEVGGGGGGGGEEDDNDKRPRGVELAWNGIDRRALWSKAQIRVRAGQHIHKYRPNTNY